MKRVDLVFFDAGGGHRGAATALKSVIEKQGRPWSARLVNLQEILDPIDILRRFTGLRVQDFYNLMLGNGWTLGMTQTLKLLHAAVKAFHEKQVRLLVKHWTVNPADLVVSLAPHFNRAMYEAVRQALPHAPYATLITDFADYPPHFWIERQPQYYICGSDLAVEQARRMGQPEDRVFRVSGMILNPKFYELPPMDRAAERLKQGLSPEWPVGLVLFGGAGSAAMAEIARRLDASGLMVQLIMVCGRNDTLAAMIRRRMRRLKALILGFTSEVPYYMRLADFFIGKPGPGSLSEAMEMSLPVIIERNRTTMPQERYNAQWVKEKQVGLVVGSFRQIARAVEELLAPENYSRFRANAAALHNRALFEVPDILERILKA
ncbi:MAG: glycosyltransferase [Terriglobia bacterium]